MEIADVVPHSSAATADADNNLAAAPRSPVGTSSRSEGEEEGLELVEFYPPSTRTEKPAPKKKVALTARETQAKSSTRVSWMAKGKGKNKSSSTTKKVAAEKRKAVQKVKQTKKRVLALYKSL